MAVFLVLRHYYLLMILFFIGIPGISSSQDCVGSDQVTPFNIHSYTDSSYSSDQYVRIPSAITCYISLSNGGNPSGTVVRLEYLESPLTVFEQVAPETGVVVFNGLTPGNYLLTAHKPGFEEFFLNTTITQDTSLDMVMLELRYRPNSLHVDSLSLIATWDAPYDVLIREGFEGPVFPPDGWQASTQNVAGWLVTTDGSIPGFVIPAHSAYAVVANADNQGNGCCDYLIMPELDFTNRQDYRLCFSSFFTGEYGQTATVEISLDGGTSWTVISSLNPAPFSWADVEIDLAEYSGAGGAENAMLAFHADDSGNDGSGWAIDDIIVRSGLVPVLGYGVYLDGLLLDYTPVLTYSYSLLLNYGQRYTAGVAALFSSGYSDPDTSSFISRFLFPPLNLEGIIPVNTDYVHLWWDEPAYLDDTTYIIQGLTGYNIYRDNILIDFVAQPEMEYFDMGIPPGIFSYKVTAVYDLSDYGFPGQTGESMIEGPVDVTISYGYELPFTENFNTGLFETNQWTVDGSNWRIHGQLGNVAPSVEFYNNPAITAYNQSLTSFYLIGSGIIDGNIMMDFDLKHTLVNATEEEFLAVEISNGGAWVKVGEFKNTANFDWTTESVDLTSLAKGHVFRVRFTAYGANTLDIFNWLVDNIRVYRECHQPENLLIRHDFPDMNDVILSWDPPGGGGNTTNEWLGWDDGTNSDAIGLTNGGTFSVAVRFTPAQLSQYAGTSLTRIRMFPYAAGGTIALKIWTGANASTLVHTQTVASYTEGFWNEFSLDTPVAVTGATELWFGYTITHAAGQYVAGCDAGPAIAGFGDMISLDGSVWESMSSAYGLNYNWNLHGYLESVEGTSALQPLTDKTIYGPRSPLIYGHLPELPDALMPDDDHLKKTGRGLVGYNIWRDGAVVGSTTKTTFTDPDMDPGWYCYTISAVYQDCESDLIDVECILVRDVSHIEKEVLRLYPNPASDAVYFDFSNNYGIFMLYDQTGRLVLRTNVKTGDVFHLNVSAYTAGNYLATFISGTGELLTGRFSVIR